MTEATAWTIFGKPVRGRACGSCKACCTQIPVELPDGHKAAGVRCKHLCSKGCSIYATRPRPCWAWSCRWLFDADTAGLRRPDQSGYIIDAMLDTIVANGRPIEVVQVWVDPKRRDAHRDPALRAYLSAVAERTAMPAIVRWNSEEGMLLVAPPIAAEGEWLELASNMVGRDDLDAKLAAVGAERINVAIAQDAAGGPTLVGEFQEEARRDEL